MENDLSGYKIVAIANSYIQALDLIKLESPIFYS
jgi:DNA-binding LytR/AlgR family response regulator